jgi:hypothetical protein
MITQEKQLYSLISLGDFKTVLGIDDRENKTASFCLVISTLSIEQYYKRLLLRKKHFDRVDFTGDLLIPLREYPVTKITAVSVFGIKNWVLGAGRF